MSGKQKASAGTEEYTVVVSGDGFEYICKKDVLTEGSQMFKGMLEEGSIFSEAKENRIGLPEFSGLVVQYACLYLYYRDKFKDDEAVPYMDVPKHMLLHVLEVSDYIRC